MRSASFSLLRVWFNIPCIDIAVVACNAAIPASGAAITNNKEPSIAAIVAGFFFA